MTVQSLVEEWVNKMIEDGVIKSEKEIPDKDYQNLIACASRHIHRNAMKEVKQMFDEK